MLFFVTTKNDKQTQTNQPSPNQPTHQQQSNHLHLLKHMVWQLYYTTVCYKN